jgi:hypothetical protein
MSTTNDKKSEAKPLKDIIAGIEKIERGIGTMAMEYWTDDDAKPLAEAIVLLQAHEAELSRVRQERDEAVKLLGVAACPSCDGRGWYAQPTMPDGEPEQIQCQFCDERSTFLAKLRT